MEFSNDVLSLKKINLGEEIYLKNSEAMMPVILLASGGVVRFKVERLNLASTSENAGGLVKPEELIIRG